VRVLICPQEFKGTLTAAEAGAAIQAGLARALPQAQLDVLPLADGGPGTVDILVRATGGSFHEATAHDPLGRPLRARWGSLGDGRTAVIEIAAASGIVLLAAEERDPARTTTFGTGEVLRAALDAGYRRLIVGVGGSATNDGGAGMAQALGARLLDADGRDLPPGGAALARLARIDASGLDLRLREAEIIVASDVTNPLCGPDGASLVYGAQKGASASLARGLDAALAQYAAIIRRDLGVDVIDVPGAGAAGGLGAGLVAFCGAHIERGFDVIAEAVGLRERIASAAAVVTGEGRLDRQTAFGKTAVGVARLARDAGRLVVAVVGSVEGGAPLEAFDAVFAVVPELASEDAAMERPAELVTRPAEQAGRWLMETLGGR
jgi:glycerate kinase